MYKYSTSNIMGENTIMLIYVAREETQHTLYRAAREEKKYKII